VISQWILKIQDSGFGSSRPYHRSFVGFLSITCHDSGRHSGQLMCISGYADQIGRNSSRHSNVLFIMFKHTTNWLCDRGIVHELTIILQLRSDSACLIFFSGMQFDKGSTIRSWDICWSSPATNWSSHIQLFASHCHCLPQWAWLSDWILKIPGMNVIALHMVLILESMGSGSREIDGDKAIGTTFSMKLLPWSCGDLCLLGCNQKFYIFG
jgi:hypothetical protein